MNETIKTLLDEIAESEMTEKEKRHYSGIVKHVGYALAKNTKIIPIAKKRSLKQKISRMLFV